MLGLDEKNAYLYKKERDMKIETCYRILARELYNKAVSRLMVLPGNDVTRIVIGKDIARTGLTAIYNNSSKNDNQAELYNKVMDEINSIVI